ncbi:hypothetical protein TNCV_365111 [Trichonephila clavipes]|nr:hypothetical protein TNCV_365111 [Trichonephila clavipes]
MVDGVKFFQSRVARRPVCNIRSRCERVRLPGTLGVMMFDPPQEVLDNTFKRFKDFFHTSSAIVKYAEGK